MIYCFDKISIIVDCFYVRGFSQVNCRVGYSVINVNREIMEAVNELGWLKVNQNVIVQTNFLLSTWPSLFSLL